MGGVVHLATRFVGSLAPGEPEPDDVRWAHQNLLPGEVGVWEAMSRPDRRHSIGVARRVVAALGEGATRPVVAAALLHDCGKTASGLGTFGRVGATIVVGVAGRPRARRWSDGSGWRGTIGRYAEHPTIGRQLLESAGSDPLTSAWAAEHHRPTRTWTVPVPIGMVLKEADDD